MTENIVFSPIEGNEEELTKDWADAIKKAGNTSRGSQSLQNCKAIGEAGFDIRLNASKLEIIYLS